MRELSIRCVLRAEYDGLSRFIELITVAQERLPKSTKLRISGQSISLPSVLEGLGDLAKRHTNLSSLEMYSIGDAGNTSQWQALRAHLRELRIPHLNMEDVKSLDLSGFSKLETLKLASTITGNDGGDVPRIIAPNLRVFEWKVKTWEHHEGDSFYPDAEARPEDFGQRQEDWVRAVVRFAHEHETKLQTIIIDFNPIDLPIPLDTMYPWDRMAGIARDSEQYGIDICYDRPNISRGDFERLLSSDP
ncbi:hypothetical protein FGRMN_9504 [Fusarium graminum]|nr:hypothetical protein FGRMN_9504 [Fusarium graminum]